MKFAVFFISLIFITANFSCKKSDVGGFIQLSPANGSSTVSTSQVFSCTAVSGAVSYTFSFTDGSGTFSKTSTTDTISVPILKPCDTYTWTVTATMADASTVSINPSWIFTTVSNSSMPCLQTPANSSLNICVNPQFTWTPVSGVSSYNLVIASDPAFLGIVFNNTMPNNYYTITSGLSANTQYYWQVSPSGSSSYSAVFTFTTVAPPVQYAPANNVTGISRSPTFFWSSGTCTNNYSVDISTFANFSSTVTTAQVTGTSYSIPPTSPLSAYTTYYWRVRVNDYVANSTVSSFTTGLN